MTTILEAVERTRSLLGGSLAEPISVLTSSYTPGDASIDLSNYRRVGEGYVLSAGLTTFHVLTADASSPRVIAGFDGSPDQPLSAGTIVRIRPLHTTWAIFQELASTISELSSSSRGLYRVFNETLAADRTWGTLPLARSPLRVLRVRGKVVGSTDVWVDVPWTFQPHSPDGPLVRVDTSIDTVHIQYATGFDTPTALTDTFSALGLPDHYIHMVAVGAGRNLALSTESRRAQPFSQGDPRRAEEVPMTANVVVHDRLKAQFRDMVNQERARLMQQHPYRSDIDTSRGILGGVL